MEYTIVVRDSNTALRIAVEEAMTVGWRPTGGVEVGYRNEWIKPKADEGIPLPRGGLLRPPPKQQMYWAQAMTREGEIK